MAEKGSTVVATLVLGVAVAVLARAAVATVEAVLSESAVAATARTPSSKRQSYTRRRNPFSYRQLYTTSIQLQRSIQALRTVVSSYNRQAFPRHSRMLTAHPSSTSNRENQSFVVRIPLPLSSKSCFAKKEKKEDDGQFLYCALRAMKHDTVNDRKDKRMNALNVEEEEEEEEEETAFHFIKRD